ERSIVGPRGLPAPELVVEHDPPPLLRQRAEPLERVVTPTGPAVQHEQWQPPRLLVLADDEGSRLPLAKRKPRQPMVQVSPAASRPARSPSPWSSRARASCSSIRRS